jgi:hypothetical protein
MNVALMLAILAALAAVLALSSYSVGFALLCAPLIASVLTAVAASW